jgi:hypothetical protein
LAGDAAGGDGGWRVAAGGAGGGHACSPVRPGTERMEVEEGDENKTKRILWALCKYAILQFYLQLLFCTDARETVKLKYGDLYSYLKG